jgi:hypothetical protein
MKPLILTLSMTLALLGCWTGAATIYYPAAQTETQKSLTPADKDDIREAVFRYQFIHNASGQQQNAKVYFLFIGKDKDPGDELIERFKDHKPPVKKGSRASLEGGAIDKETGERGLVFYATTIKEISEDKVEVEGGYYEAGLSSSGNTYTVERKDKKWVVTEDKMLWIS